MHTQTSEYAQAGQDNLSRIITHSGDLTRVRILAIFMHMASYISLYFSENS